MLVLCCGMIRSGSTLQYNLARSVVKHAGAGETVGWATGQAEGARRDEIERLASDERMKVTKSHDLLGIDRAPLPDGTFALLYSYRDIRDVAGSAKMHWGLEGDALRTWIRTALDTYDTVRRMPGVLVQSYEQLTGHTADATDEIARHLGLELASEDAEQIAARWSITSVEASGVTARRSPIAAAKGSLRAVGLDKPARAVYRLIPLDLRRRLNPIHKDDSLLHSKHISETTKKGVASRSALDEHELAFVNDAAGPWLAQHGYTRDAQA